MQIGKLGSLIQTMIPPFGRLGATDSAETLKQLRSLFEDLKDIDDNDFIEKSKGVSVSEKHSPTIGTVISVLDGALEFMQAVSASVPKKNAIKSVRNCFTHASSEISFAAFSDQIKAALLIDVVKYYSEALEIELGELGFDAIYSALKEDTRVTQPKLVEITTLFVGRTAPSAKKPQMLKRIYSRHANLVNLTKKNEWQRGKPAA